ncbi:unnamed protein product [Prunus armeniaca]
MIRSDNHQSSHHCNHRGYHHSGTSVISCKHGNKQLGPPHWSSPRLSTKERTAATTAADNGGNYDLAALVRRTSLLNPSCHDDN